MIVVRCLVFDLPSWYQSILKDSLVHPVQLIYIPDFLVIILHWHCVNTD